MARRYESRRDRREAAEGKVVLRCKKCNKKKGAVMKKRMSIPVISNCNDCVACCHRGGAIAGPHAHTLVRANTLQTTYSRDCRRTGSLPRQIQTGRLSCW